MAYMIGMPAGGPETYVSRVRGAVRNANLVTDGAMFLVTSIWLVVLKVPLNCQLRVSGVTGKVPASTCIRDRAAILFRCRPSDNHDREEVGAPGVTSKGPSRR